MNTPNIDLVENASIKKLFDTEDFMFMLCVSVAVWAIALEEEVLKTESW